MHRGGWAVGVTQDFQRIMRRLLPGERAVPHRSTGSAVKSDRGIQRREAWATANALGVTSIHTVTMKMRMGATLTKTPRKVATKTAL
jgi:hypothetical protein